MSVNVTTPVKTAAAGTSRPIRVMIVDDALVARGFVKRWVDAEPDLELVGSLRDGREAIEQLERIDPDVVVLDVEMPDIDGITALPQLLQKKPDLAIIMASTLTRRNAEISMKALALGALDCIPKPEANERAASADFQRELIDKIRHLGVAPARPAAIRARAPIAPAAPSSLPRVESGARARSRVIRMRQAAPRAGRSARCRGLSPKVLLIGSSTGGPQALDRGRFAYRQDRRPRAGADHAAHAADLHHDPCRASRARQQPRRARSRGRRTGRAGPHLSRARRHPYAREKARRTTRHRARRFRAGAFLQAGGRSAVFVRRADLGQRRVRRHPDRHGMRRHRRRRRDRRRRRRDHRAGRRDERGLGHARLPPPKPAFARRSCRSTTSHRKLSKYFLENGSDADRLRFPAQTAEGSVRPRAVGGKAISRRKPVAAGRAQGRPFDPVRARRASCAAPAPKR